MKWTVIGYWGGYPGEKEATSGYLLEHDGYRLLVDCGSGVLAQLQSFISVRDIDAVILSHYHHDHVADIGPLQFARLIESMTNGVLPELPIYAIRLIKMNSPAWIMKHIHAVMSINRIKNYKSVRLM